MMINRINNAKCPGGNRGVLAVAAGLMEQNLPFALAIVIDAQGSTYRKPGALALYAKNGITQSVISGGCLETQWHKTAQHVMEHDEPASLTLDTQNDEDLLFGSGSGCRGTMHLIIVPVRPEKTHPIYSAIVESHRQNVSLRMAVMIHAPHCGHGMAWNNNTQWCFGDDDHHHLLASLRHADNGEHQVQLKNGKEVIAVVLDIPAPIRIALIGAGVEAFPFLPLARSLGWHVTVIDHRAAQLEPLVNNADEVFHSRPTEWFNTIERKTFDAVLIMSHNAAIDLEALNTLATRDEHYVGLLGPPARRDELLSQMTDEHRNALLPRLHAPLGLRLGGNGPEPLALSIAAELQRFFHHE